jgi:hypothetical protein
LLWTGCSTTSTTSTSEKPASAAPGGASSTKFKADDGRVIDIGKATPVEGGTSYSNPHMEKGKCWVVSGFDFNGYDTIYIAPTLSTAKFPDKPEDTKVHTFAKERLPAEIVLKLNERKLFTNVITKESDIKPGSKYLKLENTIIEFRKGGGAARFWAGEFGAGQPILRVEGKLTEGDKTLFTFEARRTGVSAGARLTGSFMRDEEIQSEDIRSMVLDLTDFMAAVAGKYGTHH